MAKVLAFTVDWLEKARNYTLACLVLVRLLLEAPGAPDGLLRVANGKRGKLWLRLCIDLKHIKMKGEALRVAYFALVFDPSSTSTGGVKGGLIRLYDQLRKGKKDKSLLQAESLDKMVDEFKATQMGDLT